MPLGVTELEPERVAVVALVPGSTLNCFFSNSHSTALEVKFAISTFAPESNDSHSPELINFRVPVLSLTTVKNVPASGFVSPLVGLSADPNSIF